MEDSFSDVSKKSFALVVYLLTEKAESEWWFFLKEGERKALLSGRRYQEQSSCL
jgi:hypothetical protein